jgi:hypothetical protein
MNDVMMMMVMNDVMMNDVMMNYEGNLMIMMVVSMMLNFV